MNQDTSDPPLIEDEPIDLSDVRPHDYLVLVIFWALAGVVFLQFFTRYVLNDSLGWTEEIARFLLIATTFVGAIFVVRKGSHIAVEVLYRILPKPLRRMFQFVIDVASVVFYAALTWWSYQLAGRTFQMMVSIDVPKAWLYYGVAVCFAVMTVFALIELIRHTVTGRSRLIDQDDQATVSSVD